MRGRAILAAVVLISVLFLVMITQGGAFDDVRKNAWYEESVAYVSEHQLMTGVAENKFYPDGPVSRGMLVTILYRMEGSPAAPQTMPFGDVPSDAYYADAVAWAADAGIVSGYSERSFAPVDSVTREQVAAVLYRYAQKTGAVGAVEVSLSDYQDAETISPYARDAMAWAIASHVLEGTKADTLAPKSETTRAQVAAIIMRYHSAIR